MSDLQDRDRRHSWHPYTRHGVETSLLGVIGAEGNRLKLDDGREVIDGISSWWATLHGHGHPALVEAMTKQAQALDHVLFAGCTHEPAVRLAEELTREAPDGLTRAFFSDDGSTAIEVGLKMVLQSWVQRGEAQRRVFIALEGGYHGDTFGAMSVGDPEPFFVAFQPMLFEVRRVSPDLDELTAALDELGERCAGFILEPLIQGAAGMKMHSIEFLRGAREALSARGLPLIADEVMTGFGRTGQLFATRKAGVSPDVLCLAKGLTGGMLPLAATLATEELFSSFLSEDKSGALFHGHTFTAHPIGCAVALASLELTLAEETPAKLDAIGQRIETALLEELGGEADILHNLRRTGGVVAFESRSAETGYFSLDTLALREEALANGVLLRPLGETVYALPPACTTEEDCLAIAKAMAALARLGVAS
ncbi:MAG: adenosylmethionine--8-amino-7-oxononanoate transaminase [Planctomycetes bacterium]|nr:adenosylmethionine--8-amino-7-oxononanoate transaminase [Planctomycetota bacterium]